VLLFLLGEHVMTGVKGKMDIRYKVVFGLHSKVLVGEALQGWLL